MESIHICAGLDAGFADEDGGVVDEIQEAEGVVEIDVHAGEIAVIDAQEGVGGVWKADVGANADEVFHGVDLQEDGEAKFVSQDHHVDELAFAQTFGDEEDGIGPGGAAFVQLPGIDEEVFAEDGDGDGVFDTFKEGEVATEKVFIGEAGDRPCAGAFIPLCDVFWGKIITGVFGTDQAGRGAHAFDLCDDGDIGDILAMGDGIEEIAGLGGGEGGLADFFQRSGGLAGSDLAVLVRDDVAQHGGEMFLEL